MKRWLKRKQAFWALFLILAAASSFCGTREQGEKTAGKETNDRGTNLVLIYEKGGSKVFYDKSSVTRLSRDRIRVWLKQFETTEKAIQKRKEAGLSSQGYDAYFYTLAFFEVDCRKRTFEEMDYKDVNKNNEVLFSGRGPEQAFTVEPRTSGELLYQALCLPAQ